MGRGEKRLNRDGAPADLLSDLHVRKCDHDGLKPARSVSISGVWWSEEGVSKEHIHPPSGFHQELQGWTVL